MIEFLQKTERDDRRNPELFYQASAAGSYWAISEPRTVDLPNSLTFDASALFQVLRLAPVYSIV